MHVSLDGYVAGPQGEMDWIKVNQEIFDHVGQRIALGDTAMYGRTTYEMMESYWPEAGNKPNASKHDIEHSAWYNKTRKIVLSTSLSKAGLNNTVVLRDQLPTQIQVIKNDGDQEILLFGSPRATHSLLELNLIDGFWLFVNPIILGQGIPLFSGNYERKKLNLVSSKTFSVGVTELNYDILSEK